MWNSAGSASKQRARCRTSRRPNTSRSSANSARLLDPYRAAGAVAVAVDDRDADLAAAVRIPLRLAAIGLGVDRQPIDQPAQRERAAVRLQGQSRQQLIHA